MIKPISTVIKNIEANAEAKDRIIPTGINTIDKRYLGLAPKELWMIGAYTGSGKTFFSLQLALNCIRENKKILYCSLEMSTEALLARIWGNIARLSATDIEYGLLPKELHQTRTEAKEELDLYKDNLFIVDSAYTVSQIENEIKDLKRAEKKPDVVFVDFVQNLISHKDEYSKLSEASVQFQKMAKEYDLTVVASSQISNLEAKEGAKSKVIGYKGSGSLASSPDFGLWLENESDYDHLRKLIPVKLYFRKVRRGPNSLVNLELQFPGGRFVEATT